MDGLKEIQRIIDEWIKRNVGYWSHLAMLAKLKEELGEMAREINHLEKFKPKKDKEPKNSLKLEIGDILFSITCLANHYGVDLSDAVVATMEKYEKRDAGRFTKREKSKT